MSEMTGHPPSKTKQQGGKFDNPFIDRITRVNSYVAISFFYALATIITTYGILNDLVNAYMSAILVFTGALTFTLIEYLLHRYLFHMNTDSEFKKKMQYNIHGMHHDYPKDKDRLAMPLVASIPLAAFIFTALYFTIGNNAYAFAPGIMTGYSTYLLVHYVVHAYPPPKNFLKALWINHSIHHYRGDHYAYGVSSPLWDYVFGTMPKKKKDDEVIR